MKFLLFYITCYNSIYKVDIYLLLQNNEINRCFSDTNELIAGRTSTLNAAVVPPPSLESSGQP